MALADDLERIAAAADAQPARRGVAGVLADRAGAGAPRLPLRVRGVPTAGRTWLALDDDGRPVRDRRDVRDAVSIAALCEVAEEAAFPGDLDELRAQLVALRITEAPAGIEEAEEAARELQHTLGAPPQLATPARLDAIGAGGPAARAGARPGGAVAVHRRDAQRRGRSRTRSWAEVEAAYRGLG